jgi:hypothetical protein
MRLHKQSLNRMSFRIFPSASSWCLTLAWLAFAGFCFFAGSSSLTLICAKSSDDNVRCKILAKRFFITTSQRQVEGVNQLKIQTIEIPGAHQEKRKREAYRLALVTHRGETPLTQTYSSGYEPKAQWVRKLNNFIQDASARRLVLILPASPLILLAGLFCAGMAVLFFETTHGFLDKPSNSLRLVRWGFRGRQTMEFPLTNILRFDLARSEDRRNPPYRLTIEMAEAPAVPLRKFSRLRLRGHRQRVAQLNAFLQRSVER